MVYKICLWLGAVGTITVSFDSKRYMLLDTDFHSCLTGCTSLQDPNYYHSLHTLTKWLWHAGDRINALYTKNLTKGI